ncbi:MAG: O-antigen ligase family protein [Hyphomicrobium sp.]|uniref:O-antigen ligase family protein n=1 Tax=Hyphomicrobium sp. TaxID=82 RepID=UPI0039E435BF
MATSVEMTVKRASRKRSVGAVVEGLLTKYALPVAFFAFLCSISRIGLEFVPSTTGLSWSIAYVFLILAASQNFEVYLALVRRNAIFLLAPLFAICSAFWSIEPGLSAYSAWLLLMNYLVGFLLAERLGLKKTLIFIFCFALIIQVLSLGLVAIKYPGAFNAVGEAAGLYLHKNTLSMHACLLYFTGVLLFADGWRRPLAATGALVALMGVAASESGTGKVMIAMVSAIMTACWILTSSRRWSAFISGLSLILGCGAVAVLLLGNYDVSATILNALGKDATLTGRTELWNEAYKSFEQYPWLGVGYYAFWNSTETAATSIWIMTGQILVSFHNIYLDRLVDVGALGLSLFVASLAVLFWRSWCYFWINKSPLGAWPLVFTIYVTILGFSEYPIFYNNEFQLFFSLAAAVTSGVKMGKPITTKPR